jgi:uncharacterized protein
MSSPSTSPDFHITHEESPSGTLLAGFSSFGLAGLTAVDYLVDHLELEQQGHLTAEGLPSVTPFEDGRPRHHTRIFSRDDIDLSVLVGELFVPVSLSESFSEAVLEWTIENGVEDVAVLSGVPIAHAPDDHRTFYVATDDYRERRLVDADVPAMGSGFLDGTNASLVGQGMDSPLGVCVYVTPVHAQVPDVAAAIRLVETVSNVYELDVDAEPLQQFAAEVQRYYAELAEKMEPRTSEMPEDRMFM